MSDAFSLAVNILTVLDHGRKFAALAWSVYKDGQDGVPKIDSLDFTSKDLDKIARQLGQPGRSTQAHAPDQTDEPIHQLAERCAKIAGKMQETISELLMEGSHRKIRKSIVKAFRYKWRQSDIEALESEIEELRNEIMLNLSISIRNRTTKSLENQNTIIRELADSRGRGEDLKEKLDHMVLQQEGFVQLMVEILSSIATAPTVSSTDHNRLQASTDADLVAALNNGPQGIQDEVLTRLKVSPHRLLRIREEFKSIFRYDNMFDRETGVVEAHQVTLKWIFDQPSDETHHWHNFGQWLESDKRLYWITGKMGSGKSTLMKYISQELPETSSAGRERRCTPYLLQWARDQPLFIATFYFWAGSNKRTTLQTSTEGLYRTILSQILKAYPEAAPCVWPRRWEDLWRSHNYSTHPKLPETIELEIMLTNAIEYVSSIAKVCLFIDGLDEFEGSKDDRKGLVEWVKTIAQKFPVKICVASRPWRVFEDALQDRPHLQMEHLNSKDIHKYVSARFHEDRHFMAWKHIKAALCASIVDEIVTRAEGVFLWVNLVCTSLLEAMSEGEVVGVLRKTIAELPVEMEKLYDHILDNLEPSYKDHAAQYFFLMEASWRPLDAPILSFADDTREDSDFAIRMQQKPLTDAEMQFRRHELKKRLNSRCRGLLCLHVEREYLGERNGFGKVTVQYCHRSVKDYLSMGKIQEKLTHMLEEKFDPHLRLCSAYLAQWKCCAGIFGTQRLTVQDCVTHAAEANRDSSTMMIRLLDNLDTDLSGRLDFGDETGPGIHLNLRDREDADLIRIVALPWFGGTLLSLAVALGVIEYVRHKVTRGQGCVVKSSAVFISSETYSYTRVPRLRKRQEEIKSVEDSLRLDPSAAQVKWPLLLDALFEMGSPDPAMVSLLLDNGADPNLTVQRAAWKESAWKMVLLRLMEYFPPELPPSKLDSPPISNYAYPGTRKAWVEVLCLMLRYGYKPDIADVPYLRLVLGRNLIKAERLPHIGRCRELLSRILKENYLERA